MILLFFFLTYWLGLSFRYYWAIFCIPIILLLIIIYRRTNKKTFVISISLFFAGLSISFIRINLAKSSFQGVVYEVKDNYFLFNSNGERLYVYEKNNTREIGDILDIQGEKKETDFAVLESAFDFNEYLNKKGVFSELVPSKITVKFSPPLKLQSARRFFLSGFEGDTKSLVSSILFSMSDESNIDSSIRSLHLGKFISANGTYIYLFIGFFTFLLSLVFPKKWADIGSLAVCNIYLIFVFPKFSAIRILFILIFKWVNKYLLKEKFDYLAIVGISGIFFLTMNRFLALQQSFILGYLIPIGIFFIREAVKEYNKIAQKFIITGLIYLFLIPFEISFYNSISPFSMVFQILLTPVFLIIGFLSLLCFFRLPLHAVIKWFCSFLSTIVGGLEKVNPTFNAPPLNPILIIIYYFLLIGLLFYLKIKFKPVIKIVFLTQVLFLAAYIIPINNMISQEVTFINVGQGDACLIRNRDKTILIDTGGLSYMDVAKDSLIPFFRKNRIYRIDLAILTHNHYDHRGALESLSKNYKVRSYVDKKDSFPITFGSLTFNNYNLHAGEFEDENTNSLVIGFRLGKKDYLVTGDATKKTEELMMEDFSSIPCDILKVGHHGSDTSSSLKFIKYLNPKEAVISVGLNNSHHLPKESVLTTFKKLNIPVKRTDYLGSITYKNYIFNA